MIKKILIRMLAVTLMLIFCFVMLLLCVKAGLALFGETAFGYEIPGITEPCGLSTEELEAVLKHDLKPYAEAFIHAEEDYDINACFLASIAAAESGWGRYRHQKNNIFGFMTRSMEFESVEHNIDFVAWFLRKNYLNEHGRYYRGGTIEDIGRIWCPDNGEWVRLVTGIYANFYK